MNHDRDSLQRDISSHWLVVLDYYGKKKCWKKGKIHWMKNP